MLTNSMSDYERKTDRTGLDQWTPPDKDPDRVHCRRSPDRARRADKTVGAERWLLIAARRNEAACVALMSCCPMMMRLALRASLFDRAPKRLGRIGPRRINDRA